MSRYDGLIIPRSYNEYINKTDAATLSQALQLGGVLAQQVSAGNNAAITSDAVHKSIELITSHFTPAPIVIKHGNFQGNVYIDNKLLTINGYITFNKNIAPYSDEVLYIPNVESLYGFNIPLRLASSASAIYNVYSAGGDLVFTFASEEIPQGTYLINLSILVK